MEEGRQHHRLSAAVQPEEELRFHEYCDGCKERHDQGCDQEAEIEKDLFRADTHLQDGQGQEILFRLVEGQDGQGEIEDAQREGNRAAVPFSLEVER